MFLSKNNDNKFNIIYSENNYFGNDWGLFVDIEKIKSNLPNNHEIIRKKYNINFYNKDCYDEYELFCESTKIDIDITLENNNKSFLIKLLNIIMKIMPKIIVILIFNYVIIFVIHL